MAGTTTNLKIPYPTGTDRVADGDNAMQSLAERVDVRAPWGCLGYGETTANIDLANAQLFLQVTGVVIGAGRRILLQAYMPFWIGATATTLGYAINQDGAAVVSPYWHVHASGSGSLMGSRVITPAAGTHAYTLTASGAFHLNASAANVASLLIQDIGPVTLT